MFSYHTETDYHTELTDCSLCNVKSFIWHEEKAIWLPLCIPCLTVSTLFYGFNTVEGWCRFIKFIGHCAMILQLINLIHCMLQSLAILCHARWTYIIGVEWVSFVEAGKQRIQWQWQASSLEPVQNWCRNSETVYSRPSSSLIHHLGSFFCFVCCPESATFLSLSSTPIH